MKTGKLIFAFLIAVCCQALAQAPINFASYVDPFIGTGGHGHTFPGAVLPFGMVQLSPDTRVDGSWDGCSGYHYDDRLIYGFSHTHLSGTGCSDWGDILLMPTTEAATMNNKMYASGFSHKNEKARPGYYEVLLDKNNIKAQLTTTLRTGIHRYSFPGKQGGLLLDLLHRDKTLECNFFLIDSVTVCGYRVSSAWAQKQRVFFAMRFSKPFKKVSYAVKGQFLDKLDPSPDQRQRVEGAYFQFDLGKDKDLLVKVALSPVSTQGALRNMEAEAKHWDFEKYQKDAEEAWNQQLQKIEVKDLNKPEPGIFYTALYHSMVHPSLAMDVDGQYRGRDDKGHVAKGFTNYSVFSLWDTYRALNPLFTILEPKRTADFINSFLVQYQQSGRLPMWELSGNETDCMIGFHSVSVIADAWVKGINGFDRALAYEAMKAASDYTAYSIPLFNKQGYLQVDDENESVSKSLEYAYDDWCIAQVAQLLNKREDTKVYLKRGQAYHHLFDAGTGCMRPRKNGNWLSPFKPAEINNHFTEGNSWQYSFYVPHDLNGLVHLHQGPDNFEKKLDELFTTTEQNAGREQADVTGLIGQYAHGNEPSHHMAYIYNYINKPQKTVERVRQICRDFYKPGPAGLIGNEDCGQMSAWYVFSAMGFYPVCPGQDQYMLGAPLFDTIRIHLDNGKTFTINSTPGPGMVVAGLQVNGVTSMRPALTHSTITAGGELKFLYAAASGTNNYGRGPNSPRSRSNEETIVPAPLIQAAGRVFKDTTEIRIQPINFTGGLCVYTLDGTEPTRNSTPYTQPFYTDSSCTVKARMYSKVDSSSVTKAVLYKRKNNYTIQLLSEANPQYMAEGPESLNDGVLGSKDWRKGEWTGVQGQNFVCIADLGESKEISQLGLHCLQDTRAWIVMPKKVNFYGSADGKAYGLLGTVDNSVKAEDYTVQLQWLQKQVEPKKVRYLKIEAENFGKLPEWHEGKGGDPFIFADELQVK